MFLRRKAKENERKEKPFRKKLRDGNFTPCTTREKKSCFLSYPLKSLCFYTVQWYLQHAGFHLNDMKKGKIQTPTHTGEALNFPMTGCFLWCTEAQLATRYTTTHTRRVGSNCDLPALDNLRFLLRSTESGNVPGCAGLQSQLIGSSRTDGTTDPVQVQLAT